MQLPSFCRGQGKSWLRHSHLQQSIPKSCSSTVSCGWEMATMFTHQLQQQHVWVWKCKWSQSLQTGSFANQDATTLWTLDLFLPYWKHCFKSTQVAPKGTPPIYFHTKEKPHPLLAQLQPFLIFPLLLRFNGERLLLSSTLPPVLSLLHGLLLSSCCLASHSILPVSGSKWPETLDNSWNKQGIAWEGGCNSIQGAITLGCTGETGGSFWAATVCLTLSRNTFILRSSVL